MNALQTDGVVVVPLLTAAETAVHREAMLSAARKSPELNVAASSPSDIVIGAFGAPGTASSFHYPSVRALRKVAHLGTVDTVWSAIAGTRNLEQLVDRCVRPCIFFSFAF